MAQFEVLLSADRVECIHGADAYQLEGPLTTFFRLGGSRTVIDSWSTRLASFRTVDIVAIRRLGRVDVDPGPTDPNHTEPAGTTAEHLLELAA